MKLRSVRRSVLACVILALFLSSASGSQENTSLRPGEVLDRSTWQKAEGLLPPGILDHYKNGEWANAIVEYPRGIKLGGQDFLEGTEKNRGKFILSEAGTILDKATGKQPPYIIGFPFPDIDPADSQAAIKIFWNYSYQYWYNGNNYAHIGLDWISATGLDRRSIQDVRFLYYDAQPRELSPAENPHNLLHQMVALSLEPADLYGTAALDWRFRDGDKRDLVWAYVPALRRVRQVSPANRSDGFLGSDMSNDDGPFFDGKPEDFVWKLAGEKDFLVPIDPESLKGDVDFRKLPEGGWSSAAQSGPRLGYEVPGWKGVGWAPVSLALAKTRVWVLEATPKDRYYLYGRILLFVEKDTFEGRWNVKFDWKGELMNILLVGRGIKHSPDGKIYVDATPVGIMLAESIKMHRATAAGRTIPVSTFVNYGVRFSPSLFQYQELHRLGK